MDSALFDPSTQTDRKEIAPGTVLCLQGRASQALILLHSGMAEILDCPTPIEGLSEGDILSRSVRVGLMKGESICGVTGFDSSPTERWTIRSVSSCLVSTVPVRGDSVRTTLQNQKGLNIQVLRALQQRIESAMYLFTNFKLAWRKLASIADAVALAFDWSGTGNSSPKGESADFMDIFDDMEPADSGETSAKHVHRIPPGAPNRYEDSLEDYSSALRSETEARDLPIPEDWDSNLFLDTYQESLDRFEEFDSMGIEQVIEHPQYLFLKRVVRKNDQLLRALFHQDEPTHFYMYQEFSKGLDSLQYWNREIGQAIRDQADRLFGDGGWVERLLGLPDANLPGRLRVFIHYLGKFALRCNADLQKILSLSLPKTYPIFGELAKYRGINPAEAAISRAPEPQPEAEYPTEPVSEEEGTEDAELAGRIAEAQQKYTGLTEQILEFSEVDEEFANEFVGLLSTIRSLPDKLSTDAEAVQLRARLADMYWQLYEICFLKVISGDMIHPIPGIMLHLGLVDEQMVSPKELAELDAAYNNALTVDDPMPVMTLPYFLERIFTGEIQPSMSEMGESFAELLRRQKKMSPKERAASEVFDDTPESKIRYEIRSFARNLSTLLAENKRQAMPIVCSDNLQGPISRIYQNPIDVSQDFQGIRQRDFTAFFREVVIKHQFGTDLVRKEVRPFLVLYPVAGTRVMMWQDLDGTKKDSPGRFFMPIFYPERRDEALVTLAAQFRWELSRTVAGHNWMDPVEGGLSGAYYDYIAYYKKNPNLLPAHKQTLQDFIKRTRSDRDRFSEDYTSWMLFEFDNKIKLNPVARGIFHRFCPFPKEVREEMAKKPLYADLEMKYTNRTRKDILKLESRIKRFEKAGAPVPPEFHTYMAMLTG